MGAFEKAVATVSDQCVVIQKDGTERELRTEDVISCFGWEGTLADWVAIYGVSRHRGGPQR